MTRDSRNDLGKILKQRRRMIPMTLKELAHIAGVSSSHLARIEKGERFPSAHILRKIAKPLGLGETELFTLANYLSPQSPVAEGTVEDNVGGLDPYVARILSQEPVEVQHAVVRILIILKSIAMGYDTDRASVTTDVSGSEAKR